MSTNIQKESDMETNVRASSSENKTQMHSGKKQIDVPEDDNKILYQWQFTPNLLKKKFNNLTVLYEQDEIIEATDSPMCKSFVLEYYNIALSSVIMLDNAIMPAQLTSDGKIAFIDVILPINVYYWLPIYSIFLSDKKEMVLGHYAKTFKKTLSGDEINWKPYGEWLLESGEKLFLKYEITEFASVILQKAIPLGTLIELTEKENEINGLVLWARHDETFAIRKDEKTICSVVGPAKISFTCDNETQICHISIKEYHNDAAIAKAFVKRFLPSGLNETEDHAEIPSYALINKFLTACMPSRRKVLFDRLMMKALEKISITRYQFMLRSFKILRPAIFTLTKNQ